MDLKECRPVAIVHLPVRAPGALLALGDVHANMGDAEVAKGTARARPWLSLPDAWVSYGHAAALEDALRMATRDMIEILAVQLGLGKEDAYMLIGACGDVGIGQDCAGDIDRTARVLMPHVGRIAAAS